MPRSAIHPGEILADELTELGVTPTKLSRQICVPNRVTQIIHGRWASPATPLFVSGRPPARVADRLTQT
jgi:plasmid maintenance system antidote protein VapI